LLVISFQSIPLGSNKNSVPYQKWPLARLSSTPAAANAQKCQPQQPKAETTPARVPSEKETATRRAIFFFLSPFVLVTGAKFSLDYQSNFYFTKRTTKAQLGIIWKTKNITAENVTRNNWRIFTTTVVINCILDFVIAWKFYSVMASFKR
jgi:hypothetical protein